MYFIQVLARDIYSIVTNFCLPRLRWLPITKAQRTPTRNIMNVIVLNCWSGGLVFAVDNQRGEVFTDVGSLWGTNVNVLSPDIISFIFSLVYKRHLKI